MIEQVKINNFLYSLIIRNEPSQKGVNFISSEDDILQVGTMSHPAGYRIKPHRHLPCTRNIKGTQEVLFIKSGILKVIFFDQNNKNVGNVLLLKGDTIILLDGAHGFEIIEDIDMIEVKNGPYVASNDKVHLE